MRSTGIDPDTMFRFREYGGPYELSVNSSRIKRNDSSTLLTLQSGSKLMSPYLSGSRIEVGTPEPRGSFVNKKVFEPHGESDYVWDGLFTSGSWTVEFLVQPNTPQLLTTMSLSRVCTTGSSGEVTIANCVGVGAGPLTVQTGS